MLPETIVPSFIFKTLIYQFFSPDVMKPTSIMVTQRKEERVSVSENSIFSENCLVLMGSVGVLLSLR